MKLQEMLDQLSAGNISADDDDEAVQSTPRRRSLADALREIDTQEASTDAATPAVVEEEDYTPKPPDPDAAKLPTEELDLFNYERTAAAAASCWCAY
jgi:hypothetical protein